MLSSLWPEPVPLPLGSTEHLVSPLRLRDLAALERLADCGLVRFWADLGAAEAIPDAPERHARLRALYDRVEHGLPGFGAPEVLAALATPFGRCEELYLSLRQSRRDINRKWIVGLYGEITEDQWTLFERVAWCLDPLDEVARTIDAEIGVSFPLDPAPPHAWERLVARVARRTGWTLGQIGDLTLSQWEAVLRGGAKPGHPYAEPDRPPRGWTWKRFDAEVNARRQAFWAGEKATSTPPDSGDPPAMSSPSSPLPESGDSPESSPHSRPA